MDLSNHQMSIKRKRLKSDAVPSVFDFPDHLNSKNLIRKPPTKRTASFSKPTIPNKSNKSLFTKSNHDHSYAASPIKKVNKLKLIVSNKNKQVKRLQAQAVRRVKTVHALVEKLNSFKYISQQSAEDFVQNFNEQSIDLFKNQIKNAGKNTGSRYDQTIKEFAVTLHFYSPKGYRFVRKALCLPSPSTIRSWAASVEAEPGFLLNVVHSLRNLIKPSERDCVIILDEMSIRSQTLVDNKSGKLVGNVDYGSIQGEPRENVANHVLVVMVAGLKAKWQNPMAYFLTNNTNAEIQAQIIRESINFLTESIFNVHAVIFDGTAKNMTTAERLGCKINTHFDGSFRHPCRDDEKIHVILDACHMIKLARNALADRGIIYDSNKQPIKWDFIVKLHQAQMNDVLHLGNKLKGHHVKWQNHKMKVNIAAQTLSNSVAAAIRFLETLKAPGFENSDPTSDFILRINTIFDILNSKNRFGKAAKTPITLKNIGAIDEYIKETELYLTKLQDLDGNVMYKGRRKTFIVGFLTTAKSVIAISHKLLSREDNRFEYVLTYRFSQDALEMFFSKIRGRYGWNNNPNVLEFKYALRAILLKNNIEAPATANCIGPLDNEIQYPIDFLSINENTHTSQDVDPAVYHLLNTSPNWRYDALYYISGYIAKQMSGAMKCPECAVALYQSSSDCDHILQQKSTLLAFKAYGKLFVPSSSVFRVVQTTDKLVREMLLDWKNFTKQSKEKVVLHVLQRMKNRVFLSLQDHSMQCHILEEMIDDHITAMIKHISRRYIKIFLYQFGKVHTERIVKANRTSKRQKLTKTVIFYHD